MSLLEDTKTNSISRPRYGCAIGAMHTAAAIPRVIPITHCGPGCADKQYVSLAFYNGFQGGGYSGGAVPPSANISENEVVFGGDNRLRELIQASTKIMDADLFVVLTGCIPDIVGDDVPSVVSEFQQKGIPIVYAETGGFHGNNLVGHETVVRAIVDQFIGDYHGDKVKNTVNVWTEVPYQNTYWRGDLGEIKRILEGIGLKVNILFGHDSKGVSEWLDIPKAAFNLIISPWVGLGIAEHLKAKYHQQYLHIPAIPIGALETSDFLRRVSKFAGLNSEFTEEFIKKEEESYYKYLEDFSDFYSEYWWGVPARFAVVSDSIYSLSITKFLVKQLGLISVKQIITENTPEEYKEQIREEFRNIDRDVSLEVEFLEDGYQIEESLRTAAEKPAIIFGTTWDRDIAKELKGNIVEISFPSSYEVVLSRSYVGYKGALSLIEKIFTAAISASA
ncbi:MAG: nitrogenase molybdenum-iron protein alpha and beta chain [Eubacterium sp.]|jgi:nitrogenase molybdenum-iron protein beta chain|nr:nitrogenase molybdenum-iron protein alpha and beta chain [Eubacterium sp.]